RRWRARGRPPRRAATRSLSRSTVTVCPLGPGSAIASFRVCPAIASDSRRRMRVSSALSLSTSPFIAELRPSGTDTSPTAACPASGLLNCDLALHAQLLVVADRAVELVLARLRQVHAEHAALPRREIRLELFIAVRPLDLEAVHRLPVVG